MFGEVGVVIVIVVVFVVVGVMVVVVVMVVCSALSSCQAVKFSLAFPNPTTAFVENLITSCGQPDNPISSQQLQHEGYNNYNYFS